MSTDSTPRLGLPWLMPAQAQKHVTVNQSLGLLDALVGAAVSSRSIAAQPADPAEGDAYILPAQPGGAVWSGFAAHDLTYFQDGAWQRLAPRTGLSVFVADERELVFWDGAAWTAYSTAISVLSNLTALGVGTGPDAANPFAAKLNAALWTALETGAGGSGDLRYTLNKQGPGHTLSMLFQSGWSGRAEIGLIGDDDLSLKTSEDGAVWTTAARVDPGSGGLDLATGLSIAGAPAAALLFTPGGDGINAIWRIDGPHGPLPRSAVIAGVVGDVITLASAAAPEFANHSVWSGASYIRIWNTSKSPEEAAWFKAVPDWGAGDRQLQVTDAAHIAGWAPGETVRLGETAPSGNRVVALDISPMLEQVFGAAFPQSGVMVHGGLRSGTAGDSLSITHNGQPGQFTRIARVVNTAQYAGTGVTVIPSTARSPISNSNLVFIRSAIASTAQLEIINCVAVMR